MPKKDKPKKSDWLLSVPIYNLVIDKEIGGEIRVGNVLFVAKYRIPYVRKRLGIKRTISSIGSVFKNADSYAFIRCGRVTEDEAKNGIRLIKEAYWLLASSEIWYRGRQNLIPFGLPQHVENIWDEQYLFDTTSTVGKRSGKRVSPPSPYRLSQRWKSSVKHFFFFPLLKIVNGKTSAGVKWRRSLKRATILAAKSFFSEDIAAAFLYNWIAIELLLKKRGEKADKVIPERLTYLYGWLTNEDESFWKETIKTLYKKRNDFVHGGKTGKLMVQDVLMTDLLLYNILNSFSRLINRFPKQRDLLEFFEKAKARKTLGWKIHRPKFEYVSYNMTEKTVERIKKKTGWNA